MCGRVASPKRIFRSPRSEPQSASMWAPAAFDFDMPGALGYSGLSDKTLRKYLEEYRDVWEGGIAEEDLPISQVGAAIGVHVGPGGIAVACFSRV